MSSTGINSNQQPNLMTGNNVQYVYVADPKNQPMITYGIIAPNTNKIGVGLFTANTAYGGTSVALSSMLSGWGSNDTLGPSMGLIDDGSNRVTRFSLTDIVRALKRVGVLPVTDFEKQVMLTYQWPENK